MESENAPNEFVGVQKNMRDQADFFSREKPKKLHTI
jgi:hypothetical protein